MPIDFEAMLNPAIHAYNAKHAKVVQEVRDREDALREGQAAFREQVWGMIAESIQRASTAIAKSNGLLENIRASKADPTLTYIARIHLRTGIRELSFSHTSEGLKQLVEVTAPGCEDFAPGQTTPLNKIYPLYEFGRNEIDRCVLAFCQRALEQL